MATSPRTPPSPLRNKRMLRAVMRGWGRLLRNERLGAKFTQVELGKRADIKGLDISAWEAGNSLPTSEEWAVLKRVLRHLSPLPDLDVPLPQPVRAPRKRRTGESRPAVGAHAEFANRLRTARLAAGLSRQQLAKAAKVSAGSVANWETGGHLPQQAPLQRLRVVLAAQWGAASDPDTLAAWELSAPMVGGRLLRRRGPATEMGVLRAKIAGVSGAFGFVTRFVAAVAERRLSAQQVSLFLAMLRQLERLPTAPPAAPKPLARVAKNAATKP